MTASLTAKYALVEEKLPSQPAHQGGIPPVVAAVAKAAPEAFIEKAPVSAPPPKPAIKPKL